MKNLSNPKKHRVYNGNQQKFKHILKTIFLYNSKDDDEETDDDWLDEHATYGSEFMALNKSQQK